MTDCKHDLLSPVEWGHPDHGDDLIFMFDCGLCDETFHVRVNWEDAVNPAHQYFTVFRPA